MDGYVRIRRVIVELEDVTLLVSHITHVDDDGQHSVKSEIRVVDG